MKNVISGVIRKDNKVARFIKVLRDTQYVMPVDGLLGFWQFEDDLYTDSTALHNDLVNLNSGTTGVTRVAAKIGLGFKNIYALYGNMSVGINDPSIINMFKYDDYSLSFWAESRSTELGDLITLNNTQNPGSVGELIIRNYFNADLSIYTVEVRATYGVSTVKNIFLERPNPSPYNGFNHIVVTYEADTSICTLYINNDVSGNVTMDPSVLDISKINYLQLGDMNGSPIIDQISLYNRILDKDDVAALFNNGYGK